VSAGANATSGTDTITREGDDWFDSVVIRYSWLNKKAVPQVRYDSAGTPGGKTLLIEHSRPWPGAGAAAALLTRATARGRSFDVSAVSGYTATPGQTIQITLPSTPIQTGTTSAVTWSWPADEMTIKSRLLLDTPDEAWMFLTAGVKWTDGSIGASWVSETV
jgi:hypothetical protein